MITANRLWTIAAALVAVGLAALGYFIGVAPQLSARATALSSLSSVQTSNDALTAKVGKLASESRNLGTLQAQLDALSRSLPATAAASSFVSQLGAAASSAGVTLSGITETAAAPNAAPPAPAGAAASASATPSASGSGAPASAAAGMPPFTSSAVTGSTMAVIPVTITASGSYADILNFVKAVQNMQRYCLVTGISTSRDNGTSGASGAPSSGTPATSSGAVDVSITGDIFSMTGAAPTVSSTATPAPTQ